jgi:hypothetical protein
VSSRGVDRIRQLEALSLIPPDYLLISGAGGKNLPESCQVAALRGIQISFRLLVGLIRTGEKTGVERGKKRESV